MTLILTLAAGIRIAGLTTEPIWLDEAFTFYLSSGSIEEIVTANAKDTHPPLYSLEIAGIRRFLGDSKAIVRGFSTVMSLLGIALVMLMGKEMGGIRVSIMAGLLAAVNPLDIYFAQEARMYSQAAVLATASSWLLLLWIHSRSQENCRGSNWWLWAILYCGTSILLCLTHLVGTMVLFAQGIFFLLYLLFRRRFWQAFVYSAIGCSCLVAVTIWAIFVIKIRGTFFSSAYLGWIQPQTIASGFQFLVDQFFLAFCGGQLGDARKFVSSLAWVLVFFVVVSAVFYSAKHLTSFAGKWRPVPRGLDRVFLLWLTVGPVFLALLVSRMSNPIYYPSRFSLLVLSPFLILSAVECNQLGSKVRGNIAFGFIFLLMAVGSWCQAVTITKSGMADFTELWLREGPPDAAVFSPGHNRVMASYYTGQVIRPATQSSIEGKLREEPLTVWVCASPRAPALNDGVGQLAEWAIGLGAHQELGTFDGVLVTEVVADQVPRSYPPLPENRQIKFGEEVSEKYLWAGWHEGGRAHRWSRGNRAEVVFALNSPEKYSRITLKMFCFHQQNISVVLNHKTIDSFLCESRNPHLREIVVPTGSFKAENSLTFLLPDAIAPNQVSGSRDSRELAVGIQWLRMDGKQ